jgi:hypothetical protein
MAHVCNPRYSGGRDQEDSGSKPAWAEFTRSYPNTLHKNRAGGVVQGEGPEFKPQYFISHIINCRRCSIILDFVR